MQEKFYEKIPYGISVQICSAEEAEAETGVHRQIHTKDIDELIESLKRDKEFEKLAKGQNIQSLVEIIVAHHTRISLRKYMNIRE